MSLEVALGPREDAGFSPISSVETLLEPIRIAVENSCPVVAQGLWCHFDGTTHIPFLLHGVWCDRIPGLRLNASFAMVPFRAEDAAALRGRLYSAYDVQAARETARATRCAENRLRSDDLYLPAWEHGLRRNGAVCNAARLPGNSFLGLDVIATDGKTRRCARPVLGRFAVRGSAITRPSLRVPNARCSSTDAPAIASLLEAEVLLVNLQGIHGARTLHFFRAILQARGDRRPTVVIAASPGELLLLGDHVLPASTRVHPVGSPPVLDSVRVALVDHSRPQHEREFDATLRELRGKSSVHDRMVRLGLAAWWAANQSLIPDPDADYSIRRFLAAHASMTMRDSPEASDFNAFVAMLLRRLADPDRIEERRSVLVAEALRHVNSTKDALAIVLRQAASAHLLQESLASALDCQPEQLVEWGIQVSSISSLRYLRPTPALLMCGFNGPSSLDAVLSADRTQAILVVDPVEASLALTTFRRALHWVEQSGQSHTSLQALVAAVAPVAIHGAGIAAHFDFESYPILSTSQFQHDEKVGNAKRRLLISFVDGSHLVADSTRGFDRVMQGTGRSVNVEAAKLLPGDEVVLTDGAADFSERLLNSLDNGPLAAHVANRRAWVLTVQSIVQARKLRKTQIHRELGDAGIQVDYQTVRGWITPLDGEDRVPRSWAHFRGLAQVLRVTLPEQSLREMFASIRTLRVMHRKAGRDLVRMIVAARNGCLDPVTLRRVETQFGLSARELIQATRVMLIDDIIVEE